MTDVTFPPARRTAGRWLVVLLCVGAVALAAPAAAAAHASAADSDYRSVVDGISPYGTAVQAEVRQGDDRLRVTNVGPGELVVLGYEQEPYVRIGPDGVFVNHNSRAYYLNQDRFAETDVPSSAGPGRPEWHRVDTTLPVYEFHDHRIHWTSKRPPRTIDPDASGRQVVYHWVVPVVYAGHPGGITGTLTYQAPKRWFTSGAAIAAAAAVLLLVVVLGVGAVRVRRRRRAEPGGTA